MKIKFLKILITMSAFLITGNIISGNLLNHKGIDIPEKNQFKIEEVNKSSMIYKLTYKLDVFSNVRIYIFDVYDNLIREVLDTYQDAGKYVYNVDASDLKSGIYKFRLEINGYSEYKRFLR